MIARTKIVMELDGKNFPIQTFNFTLTQETDYTGQPASEVMGGKIEMELESPEKNELMAWMCDAYMRKDGKITVHKSEETGRFAELEFKQAFMTNYKETFLESGLGIINLTISCIEIKMGEAVHLNEWVED
ncbi:MAG: hypothetical protein HQ522_02945 [Bacteroidetes bacterium]|nr:hypothetical protein [Bacteroidota bacterium]